MNYQITGLRSVIIIQMQQKSQLFHEEFDTFELTVVLSNSKLTILAKDLAEYNIYEGQYSQENRGRQIPKNIKLQDILNAFLESQSVKAEAGIKNYEFGSTISNGNGQSCYKIEKEGKITVFKKMKKRNTNNYKVIQINLKLQRTRSMTKAEITLEKHKAQLGKISEPMKVQKQKPQAIKLNIPSQLKEENSLPNTQNRPKACAPEKSFLANQNKPNQSAPNKFSPQKYKNRNIYNHKLDLELMEAAKRRDLEASTKLIKDGANINYLYCHMLPTKKKFPTKNRHRGWSVPSLFTTKKSAGCFFWAVTGKCRNGGLCHYIHYQPPKQNYLPQRNLASKVKYVPKPDAPISLTRRQINKNQGTTSRERWAQRKNSSRYQNIYQQRPRQGGVWREASRTESQTTRRVSAEGITRYRQFGSRRFEDKSSFYGSRTYRESQRNDKNSSQANSISNW